MFPRIKKHREVVIPEINSPFAIADAEEAFESMCKGKFESDRPGTKEVYVYSDFMKPWFHNFNNEALINNKELEKLYGQYLRGLLISSLRRIYGRNKDIQDGAGPIAQIKSYWRILPLSLAQAKVDSAALRVCRLMGPGYEQELKRQLSNFNRKTSVR